MPQITPQQLESIGNPQAHLGKVSDGSPSPREEDANLRAARQKIEEEARRAKLENDDYAAEIEARRKYAKGLFKLVSWWIFAILIILLLQGFLGKGGTPIDWTIACFHWTSVIHFDLSENIILALIGGTTAGVLGLFHIVAVHFFPGKKDNLP